MLLLLFLDVFGSLLELLLENFNLGRLSREGILRLHLRVLGALRLSLELLLERRGIRERGGELCLDIVALRLRRRERRRELFRLRLPRGALGI